MAAMVSSEYITECWMPLTFSNVRQRSLYYAVAKPETAPRASQVCDQWLDPLNNTGSLEFLKQFQRASYIQAMLFCDPRASAFIEHFFRKA